MQSTLHAQDQSKSVDWAIAIHGGAGGDPAKWGTAKREARQRGLQQALKTGREILSAGGTSLNAVEAVIRTLEDDASFNAGRGAVVTEDGDIELDASIMDGKTGGCGAVAAVTTVKNPISLARLVMTETKHVLLAGPGADEFASEQKVPLVQKDYFIGHVRPSPDQPNKIGTVGCVALDSHGNLAAGTSTGGTSKKLPGRVGDSPIVGAGTFAANGAAAVSGTGIGEQYIRHAVAYDIIAQHRYAGHSLEHAVTQIMTKRLNKGDGGLICVSQTGQIVMQHNTPGLSCGAADSNGRFETFLQLENGGRAATTASTASDQEEITRLIQQQAVDWNNGDIDGFMKVYWQSEKLTFSSGGNVTRGWDATLARYQQRYPDKQTMGAVRFTDLEFLRLDETAMQVLGVWKLQREEKPIGGRFTLIWRRFPVGWRIVHDHTSVKAD